MLYFRTIRGRSLLYKLSVFKFLIDRVRKLTVNVALGDRSKMAGNFRL